MFKRVLEFFNDYFFNDEENTEDNNNDNKYSKSDISVQHQYETTKPNVQFQILQSNEMTLHKPNELVEDFKIQSYPGERADTTRLKVFLRNYRSFPSNKNTQIHYIKLCKRDMQYLADRLYANEKVRPTYIQLWNMLPDYTDACVSDGYAKHIEYIYHMLIDTYFTSNRQHKKYESMKRFIQNETDRMNTYESNKNRMSDADSHHYYFDYESNDSHHSQYNHSNHQKTKSKQSKTRNGKGNGKGNKGGRWIKKGECDYVKR